MAACGVMSPPQPPRLERPAPIQDLAAVQIGRTLHLRFKLPVLATDGERLTKPLELEIFRAVAAPGETPAPPATTGPPWVRLRRDDLGRYVRKGNVDYPTSLSAPDYRQQLGSTFSFRVVALTRGFRGRPRKSAPSNLAQVKLIDASEPVARVRIQTTQSALELSWPAPTKTLTGAPAANLVGYQVYGSDSGDPGSFQLLAETRKTQFAEPSFQFGKTYYFQVCAVTGATGARAESAPSPTAEVTPKDVFPPAVPQQVTAIYTAGAVDLLWNANTDADLAGYNVYRKIQGGAYARVNPKLLATPIYHDTSVERGKTYVYAVTAVDLAGNESAKSKPVKVSTRLPGGP